MTSQKLNFKVVLVGPPDLIKGKLIKRIIHDHPNPNPNSNIDPAYAKYILNTGSQEIELKIWETPGVKPFANIGSLYWKDSNSCIFLYDQKTNPSLDVLEEFYQLVKESLENPCYMIVAANEDDISPSEVHDEEIKEWCNQKGLEHTIISIKTGRGVNEMLLEIATKCYEMSKSKA